MIRKGYTNPVEKLHKEDIDQLIVCALKEDEADEDITTFSIFDQPGEARAKVVIKADTGVLSGVDMVRWTYEGVDPHVRITEIKKDGDSLTKGDTIMEIHGNIQSILRGERIALNFLGAMSGIASQTRRIVEKLERWGILPIDTRKTLPGFRRLSKYSVIQGGGRNHRISLGDMGLIKENHILHAGGVKNAIQKFKAKYPDKILEVEVESMEELKQALPEKPDFILLDNMITPMISECVDIIREFNKANSCQIYSEASGGFNYDNVNRLEGTGVDFVSIGAMTSNIVPVDFSLLVY